MNKNIVIRKDVALALKQHKPVVALESTIITHGMPYPSNVKTSKGVEAIIRKCGAVPATIAIIQGKIVIGLDDKQIEYLAKHESVKVSKRDIPVVVAKKLNGSTTVAATMWCAKQVGIEVFVTGGIGGVHREAEKTFDISADLDELGATGVTVVCAGAKAILDIPKTLEYLETKGVTVLSYKNKKFAAFYTSSSTEDAPFVCDSEKEIAEIIRTKRELGIPGGVLVSNPILEKDSLDSQQIGNVIKDALEKAKKKKISGKAVTPFLLSEVLKLSKGKSLEANIKLIENNAKIGANIAKFFCEK